MKYVKMIGLAAVAGMAFMAFVGASSASADVLCTENVANCPKAKTVTSIEATITKGTSPILETTAGEALVTCTGSTIARNIEKQNLGVNPSGKITKLEWFGCNHKTVTVAKGELEVQTVSGKNTVVSRNSEVTVEIFGVTCTYGTGAGTSLGNLTTGTPATLSINTVVSRTAGGFLCPGSARWTANYTITNHTSVFVSTEGE